MSVTAQPAYPIEAIHTGQRPVAPPVALGSENPVVSGVRLVRTRQGLALFDEKGRFIGIVRRPNPATGFGPAGTTVLLRR